MSTNMINDIYDTECYMKRIYIAAILTALTLLTLVFLAVVKNNELILQGEVDTRTYDLSSKITGRVKRIHIEEGDMVQAGQTLITLDIPDITAKHEQAKAAVDIAKAKQLEINNGIREEQKKINLDALHQAENKLRLAEKDYNRMKNLSDAGAVPVQKFDEAKTNYKNALKARDMALESVRMDINGSRYEEKLFAAANVKQAQSNQQEIKSYIDENEIKSPISGQVKEIAIEKGELAGAGYTIISIVDVTDNWIVLNLREDLVSKIKIGSEFNVKIPAIGKENIRVKVNYISAMGNYSTWRATKIRGDFDLKTFEIHAKPIEPVEGMIAGMSVIVDWNKVGKK